MGGRVRAWWWSMFSCWMWATALGESPLTVAYEPKRGRATAAPSASGDCSGDISGELDRFLLGGNAGEELLSEYGGEGRSSWRPFSATAGFPLRAAAQSSRGGAGARGSGACSGLFLTMGRTGTVSPFIPLTLYSLRGEGGEVLPFTAVNPEPRGSPARSLSMKPGVLVRGACRTAGMIGGRPRQRVWLQEGEECVRWVRVDQDDVFRRAGGQDRIATGVEAFTAALGPVFQTRWVGVSRIL